MESKHLIVVGVDRGDEGKARVVDYFSSDYDYVVRFQGGNNAGHSIVVNGIKTVLHLVPCGILYPHTINLIGHGVVVDPDVLEEELHQLEIAGVPNVRQRVIVSDKAHLITKQHILTDTLREAGPSKIGTTKRGVGPCYGDKALRTGLKASWLAGKDIQVGNVTEILKYAFLNNKRVMYEGAQGIMLDVDFGVYPYTTSSHTLPQYAGIGSGFPLQEGTEVYGVVKAYTTYVGEGPFIPDLKLHGFDDIDAHIREVGKEYGSTTGRPRRIGWLDLPALKYACEVGNIKKLVLTKLDVLTGLDPHICYGYDNQDTRQGHDISWTQEGLSDTTPLFQEVTGWTQNLSKVKSFDELDFRIKEFIYIIEVYTGAKVVYVSTGPERSQMLKVTE